jgi:5'-3' exonuclease
MGIPYYFYTIYKKYQNSESLMIKEADMGNLGTDCLFFDYNSMIHPCAQQALSAGHEQHNIEDEIIKSTIAYTKHTINLIKPKVAYIVIDGVAPRAKINQQRERRYKSTFLRKAEEFPQNETIYWDTNKITPGTGFMKRLRIALDVFKLEMTKDKSCDILISDSDDCGEGEHKMMKIISDSKFERICIYGLDADLIMLSLLNTCANKIVLIRDNTFNTKVQESERTFTYLAIDKLKNAICQDLRLQCKSELPFTDEKLLWDYIFLCFLLGNDFLEHLPSLIIKENGVNVLMKFYTKALVTNRKLLINIFEKDESNSQISKRINLMMLLQILNDLSKTEDYFFSNVYSVYKTVSKETYRDISLDSFTNDKVFFFKEDTIKYNTTGYKQRYYMYYGINDVESVCKDYLEGLYWILGYYNNHDHNNWTWYYHHHGTPFISDLCNYLKRHGQEFASYIDNSSNLQKTIPNTTTEQLFMVLPRESLLNILKEENAKMYGKAERIFRTDSYSICKYYPNKLSIDLIHKEYLWQSKVFFDHFDKSIIDIFF